MAHGMSWLTAHGSWQPGMGMASICLPFSCRQRPNFASTLISANMHAGAGMDAGLASADAGCMPARSRRQCCSRRRAIRSRRRPSARAAALKESAALETRLSRLTGLHESAFDMASFGTSGGEEVAVCWDLDNLPVRGVAAALLTAIRLKLLVARLAGRPVTHFAAYANASTLANAGRLPCERTLMADVSQALALAGAWLFPVKVRRNSADLVLRTHACGFAEATGSRGTLAIISADSDHAPVAKYCRSRGCRVLALGSLGRWDAFKPQRWTRAPLAQRASLAVRWDASAADAASPEERRALQELSKEVPAAAELVAEALGRPAVAGSPVSYWAAQRQGQQALAWDWREAAAELNTPAR